MGGIFDVEEDLLDETHLILRLVGEAAQVRASMSSFRQEGSRRKSLA